MRDKRYLRQTISTVNRTITVNQLNMSCTFYLEIFKLRFIFEQRIYFWHGDEYKAKPVFINTVAPANALLNSFLLPI